MKRSGKYNAQPTVVDGVRFASKKEARRDAELQLLQRAGEITSLKRQPRFPLNINGETVTSYVGDWQYVEIQKDGSLVYVVEDAKGMQTPVFKLKWKIMNALYPAISWRIS